MTRTSEPNGLSLHSADAEQRVLACVLRDGSKLDDVAPPLAAGDFYADAHQRMFRALTGMRARGAAIDLPGLAEELKRSSELEDVGGAAYLFEVFHSDPVAADARRWAGIVREYAQLRRLRQAALAVAAAVDARQGPAADLIEQAQRDILALGEGAGDEGETALDDAMGEVLLRMDQGVGRGVPTGVVALDQLTGGMRAGELILVAARPGVGKTAVGLTVAAHVASVERRPVVFVSLEMGCPELTQRVMGAAAGLNGHRVRMGNLHGADADAMLAARDSLAGSPLTIVDAPGTTVSRLAARCRRIKARRGLDLLVVDYLGLVTPEDHRQPRHEQVAVVSRRLKLLARELSVPVLCLSQLNRESENRAGGRPRLSDLRDSGAVEQDADAVVLLSRIESQPDDLLMDLVEQRNGPVGEFTVRFDRTTQRIGDPRGLHRLSPFPD